MDRMLFLLNIYEMFVCVDLDGHLIIYNGLFYLCNPLSSIKDKDAGSKTPPPLSRAKGV